MLGNLSGYILSIVGIVLLSVIVDVLLSEHSISKYVKSFMALIIVFVIISPVIKFKNGEFNLNFDNIFQGETSIDQNLADKLNAKKKIELEKTLLTKAEGKGVKGISFKIFLLDKSAEFKVAKIEVLADRGLSDKEKESISEIIKTSVYISLEQIVYL